jgi:hypothetical protein
MARTAWLIAALWFAFVLVFSFGWVGSGLAFLYWSVPAALLSLLTLRWWTKVRLLPNLFGLVILGILWLALAFAAWDGGNHFLPASLFNVMTISTVAFPILVTGLALWRIGELAHSPAAV